MVYKVNPDYLLVFRRRHALSQEELADNLGITRQTIINWEKGVTVPNETQLLRLKRLYDLETIDELYDHAKPYNDHRVIREPEGPYEVRSGSINKSRGGKDSDVDLQSVRPLNPDNTVTLPLLASIPAGLPDYSSKDIESFTQVPRYLFPGADFIIHCCGDSMEPDIRKGDYCVIQKETQPLHGKVMLVKTEDGFTIKRVMKKGDHIELHPANGNHKIIKPKELKIIGAVIGLWHRMG